MLDDPECHQKAISIILEVQNNQLKESEADRKSVV